MNKTFIQDCQETSMQYHQQKELQKQLQMYTPGWQRKYDDKMYELTAIYYTDLKKSIESKSNKGIRELYYNLSWDHFKFNLPNTGKPSKMCRVWLNQMCNPESMYLCEGVQNGVISYRDHFQGLKFDVWNNNAFTFHFTW